MVHSMSTFFTGKEDMILKIKYDKKLLVAMGKSRMAKSWQNREILWSELLRGSADRRPGAAGCGL